MITLFFFDDCCGVIWGRPELAQALHACGATVINKRDEVLS